MYKYFVSIATIFKDDTYYFIEWIEHYLAQGIEHFYLIDNGSITNYIQQIQLYIDKGLVDLFIDSEKISPAELYNKNIVTKIKEETQWIAAISLNEFSYAQHDNIISDVLKKDTYNDKNHVIGLNIAFKTNESVQQQISASHKSILPPINNKNNFVSIVENLTNRCKYEHTTIADIRLFERTNKSTLFIPFPEEHNISEEIIPTFDILINHYLIEPSINLPCPKGQIKLEASCPVLQNIVTESSFNQIKDLKLYDKNKNIFLKLKEYRVPIIINVNNNMIDVAKILYGVNENQTIDITELTIKYLQSEGILNASDNIHHIIGHDPYYNVPKKMFIYDHDTTKPKIIVDEISQNLTSNLIMPSKIKKNIDILIYLIYHDDASYKIVEKYKNYNYIKLFYNESTKYFESNIFKYLNENKQEWTNKDYVGILTYSFERHIKFSMDTIYAKLVQMLLKSDVNLIIFYRDHLYLPPKFHGKIETILNYTLPTFGFQIPIDYNIVPAFYRNYWITNPKWMTMYLDFVLKYIDCLENVNDKHLQEMLYTDSKYDGPLCKSRLVQIMGVPYYTHHCFLTERLPCLFFWKHNISYTLFR